MVTHPRGTSGKHMVSERRACRTLDITKQLHSTFTAWLSHGAVRLGVYPGIPIPVGLFERLRVELMAPQSEGKNGCNHCSLLFSMIIRFFFESNSSMV